MSNMSYCRFQNTLNDLTDCAEHFTDELEGQEAKARLRMLKIIKNLADYTEGDLPTEKEDENKEEEKS